jgi:predicted Rdx family selenoprotein
LQAAIKEAIGIEARLTGGHGGVFRVTADGKVVFDRHENGGRYPEPQEILDLLKN